MTSCNVKELSAVLVHSSKPRGTDTCLITIPVSVAKEIDHELVDGLWRMIQNCRVYRSAQFLNTVHRLIVATLKLQLKSRRMIPSQPKLDVSKLKDERVAEEFANRLSGDLGGLGALGETEELWSAFKITFLDVAGGCLGTHRRIHL